MASWTCSRLTSRRHRRPGEWRRSAFCRSCRTSARRCGEWSRPSSPKSTSTSRPTRASTSSECSQPHPTPTSPPGSRRRVSPDVELPEAARCVIIGGGVGGTSIAYHLAELGWDDVVLLERAELTSGSPFHSAGLVGQLRGSVSLTKMMMHSVELYRRVGEESEFDPGWVECGSIRLASSEARMEELRRQAGWAKTFGLPLELISADEAKELFPLMSTDGVVGAAWLPTDGYIDPAQLTYALADRARRGGCRVFTSARVLGIDVVEGRVGGVRTERGDIEAEVVVDAGGMYAAEIGRMAGVRVPVIPMAHEYLVTQPFRDPD